MSKGLSSVKTLTAKEIADKWKLPLAVVAKKIAAGVKVEKEHTKSTRQANEIARDHLGERPDYYDQLDKMEKKKIVRENTTFTAGVAGLGLNTGTPAIDDDNGYISTNALAYDPLNGAKLEFMKKIHNRLHKEIGFNYFNPTNKKHSNKELSEARLNELGEYDNKGGSSGYEGISGPIRAMRKNDQIEEGPKLNKAKKLAMAGMTAANLYTVGDVASRAGEGRGSPKGDVVRAASTLPGVAGWGATGVHYAKKAYDYIKARNMKEQSPANRSYTERPIYERGKTPADMADAAERGIYEGWASIGHPYDRFGDVNRKAKFYGKKPKATTTKSDEKDDTYKDSKQGGKVKFAKTVKEATYQGKEVSLNKPMKGDVKKSKVYVDPDGDGKAQKVNFGDKKLSIKKDQPSRKKSYCARSGGITGKKDVTSANYWSRKAWDCEEEAQFNEYWTPFITPHHKHSARLSKEKANKPDMIMDPGAAGTTKTIHEETKMDKELINEALDCILEDNLSEMKENLMLALQEKAMEKLEERKKEIAASYFAQ